MERYRAVYRGGDGRYEEKKSVFLSSVRPVKTEEEAVAFIESVRKKHWDARHTCWAYSVGAEYPVLRASDDGEPQGTAGRPILDVLDGAGLRNAVITVTRYFGGTLLGTGGLVRAYTAAASDGLKNSILADKIYGCRVMLATDYNGVGKLQYFLAQNKIPVLGAEYAEDVRTEVILPAGQEKDLAAELAELTAGRGRTEIIRYTWYMQADGRIIPED